MGRQSKSSESVFTYTDSDVSQFEKLMRFSAPVRRELEPEAERPSEPFFRYTQEDDRQFQKLMGLAVPKGGGRAQSRRGGRYTNTDTELFDRLTPTPRHVAAAAARAIPAPAAASASVQYTEQDLAAFRKLSTGGIPAEPSTHPAQPPRRDRDVGPIRIVDTDLERERQRRSRNRRDPRIKVRFFE